MFLCGALQKKKDWKEGLILCRKYLQKEEGRGNR